MKTRTKKIILTGGVFNSLLALFHIYLGYEIFTMYSDKDFYPLMQMLNIGGSLMIFFFAYTSLFYASELTTSKTGKAIIVLNILLYLSRTLGEIILFPNPKPVIIFVCLFIASLYSIAYYDGFKLSDSSGAKLKQ